MSAQDNVERLFALNATLTSRCDALEEALRRYLPVIERAEANAEVWAMLTLGTGLATANGYRAALTSLERKEG